MFCEKISVAVKAMNVITFVVKKGARTVSGASAVAVAMKSPLPSCDGTTCSHWGARRGGCRRLPLDELFVIGLVVTEWVADTDDVGDAHVIKEKYGTEERRIR